MSRPCQQEVIGLQLVRGSSVVRADSLFSRSQPASVGRDARRRGHVHTGRDEPRIRPNDLRTATPRATEGGSDTKLGYRLSSLIDRFRRLELHHPSGPRR